MSDADPPKIEPGRGRLTYDKARRTIVASREPSTQDHIRKFLGKRSSEDVTKISEVIMALQMMDGSDRRDAFSAMRCFFCTECGVDDPSCQCWNDE